MHEHVPFSFAPWFLGVEKQHPAKPGLQALKMFKYLGKVELFIFIILKAFFISLYICVCVYVYIYIYTHIHIYIHTHTHTYFFSPQRIRIEFSGCEIVMSEESYLSFLFLLVKPLS